MNGPPSRRTSSHGTPAQALKLLKEGNQRFQNGVRSIESMTSNSRREDLAKSQSPFAIVLACSDSRAPAEILFDCGLGDLFVVRVAGNIAAPSLVGSVEFAAAKFGTQLVVVLGHSRCGAVTAALDTLRNRGSVLSENVTDIVDRVKPGIAEIVNSSLPPEEVDKLAIRANVRVSASHLRHGSRLLEKRIQDGLLVVVGAEYDLDTGAVEFFDGMDHPSLDDAPPSSVLRNDPPKK